MYIVELEKGVWLSPWEGDFGRTLVKESAREFKSKAQAFRAIESALKYRDFQNPIVVEITQPANTPDGLTPADD